MSVINWDTSPSWATEYGVVGNARHPVWANENVFQYYIKYVINMISYINLFQKIYSINFNF